MEEKLSWSEGILVPRGERICKAMSGGELMLFAQLTDYIGEDNGILKTALSPYGKPFTNISAIASRIERKYNIVYKQMHSLMQNEIFKEFVTEDPDGKDMTVYICNPFFFYRGNPTKSGILELFGDTKWAKWNHEDSLYKPY